MFHLKGHTPQQAVLINCWNWGMALAFAQSEGWNPEGTTRISPTQPWSRSGAASSGPRQPLNRGGYSTNGGSWVTDTDAASFGRALKTVLSRALVVRGADHVPVVRGGSVAELQPQIEGLVSKWKSAVEASRRARRYAIDPIQKLRFEQIVDLCGGGGFMID